MSAASVAVIYADRGKSARAIMQILCFFVMRLVRAMWISDDNPCFLAAARCREDDASDRPGGGVEGKNRVVTVLS
jgi:hypothetical protein